MSANRDDGWTPLTDADRAARYRARQRGESVPTRRPGPRPAPPQPHHVIATRYAAALLHDLGWLRPEDVDNFLGLLLGEITRQIDRLGYHNYPAITQIAAELDGKTVNKGDGPLSKDEKANSHIMSVSADGQHGTNQSYHEYPDSS